MSSQNKKNKFSPTKQQLYLFYRTIVPNRKNALYLFLSFCAALSLWFSVSTQEQVDAHYTVRLDYIGLPENLTIKEGMLDSVSVRLRGSAQFFSAINNRDLVHTLDFSNIQEGASIIPLDFYDKEPYESFDIVSIEPAQLVIVSEEVLTKEVQLETLMLESTALEDYIIKDVLVSPTTVQVTGGESIVASLSRILAPFTPAITKGEGRHTESIAVVIPHSTKADPPIVNISYTVEARTKEMSFTVPISILTDDQVEFYSLNKEEVLITLDIPLSMAKVLEEEKSRKENTRLEEFINSIKIIAEPSGVSQEEVALSYRLPASVDFVSMKPRLVQIKRSEE